MAAAWLSAGTVAVVDAFMQAVPAIVQMKAMIDAGWIGEVFGADVAFEVPLFSAAQTNVPGYVWFADPANGASAGRNLGRHMLHLLVPAFGPIASVTATHSLAPTAWPIDCVTVLPHVPSPTSLHLPHPNG